MGRSSTTRRGPLPHPKVVADDPTLTRFAGVLPFIHFCEALDLPALLMAVVPAPTRRRVHAAHRVLFTFMVAAVIGTERMAHLDWYDGDPLLLKMLRLSSWPVRKVFSLALEMVDDAGIGRLLNVLTNLSLRSIFGETSCVIDFDSTALVCFGEQSGAVFGYCGKGRNRRRHHPLVASVGQGRTVINAKYRDGSGIDADECIAFFADTVARIRERQPGMEVKIRADSGFWSGKMAAWFLDQKIHFACSLPLQAGFKLLLWKAEFTRVETMDPVLLEPGDDDAEYEEGLDIATIPGALLGMDPRLKVVVIRRRIHDPKAPPSGKKIEHEPESRYHAIVTSLDWDAVDCWRFYNDRGDAERVFKTGKQALSLGKLVSQNFRANEVAFLLRLLAYNVDVLFQQAAERAAIAEKRPVIRMGLKARQPRLYGMAGRLLRVHDAWVLRIPKSKRVAALFEYFDPRGMRPA